MKSINSLIDFENNELANIVLPKGDTSSIDSALASDVAKIGYDTELNVIKYKDDVGIKALASVSDLSSYLPLAGGTLSGNLTIDGGANTAILMQSSSPKWIATTGTEGMGIYFLNDFVGFRRKTPSVNDVFMGVLGENFHMGRNFNSNGGFSNLFAGSNVSTIHSSANYNFIWTANMMTFNENASRNMLWGSHGYGTFGNSTMYNFLGGSTSGINFSNNTFSNFFYGNGGGTIISGSNNVFFGNISGGSVTGIGNFIFGSINTTITANYNFLFGSLTGVNLTAGNNFILGSGSGGAISGSSNVILNSQSGTNISGLYNVTVGGLSGGTINGNYNFMGGTGGGNSLNSSSNGNFAFGNVSGLNLTNSSNNFFANSVTSTISSVSNSFFAIEALTGATMSNISSSAFLGVTGGSTMAGSQIYMFGQLYSCTISGRFMVFSGFGIDVVEDHLYTDLVYSSYYGYNREITNTGIKNTFINLFEVVNSAGNVNESVIIGVKEIDFDLYSSKENAVIITDLTFTSDGDGYWGTLKSDSLTNDNVWILPDASGTIALISDLNSYLPLTGGTIAGELTLNLGSDADGDLYYRAGGTLVRLPVGTNGQVLTVVSGIPTWV